MDLQKRNEENRQFFAEKVNEYDDVHQKFMGTKKELINAIDVEPNKVIDLGAGTGLELISFFEKYPNSRVKAIDLTEEMLNKIKERDFADKVDIVCGDFFEVDFGKDNDVIMSTSALHHFLYDEKIKLYQKIYDSLKAGGEFINTDYIVNTIIEEQDGLYNYENNVYPHNDTPLTADHEIEILKKVGFTDIEVFKSEVGSYKTIRARKNKPKEAKGRLPLFIGMEIFCFICVLIIDWLLDSVLIKSGSILPLDQFIVYILRFILTICGFIVFPIINIILVVKSKKKKSVKAIICILVVLPIILYVTKLIIFYVTGGINRMMNTDYRDYPTIDTQEMYKRWYESQINR